MFPGGKMTRRSSEIFGPQPRSYRVRKPLDAPSRLLGNWRDVLPDQDLVLHIPNLHKSFERSQADVSIRGKGQGVAYGARGGHLSPDLGGGCQVPESQSPGHSPCDETLFIGKQLACKDTIPRVLEEEHMLSVC